METGEKIARVISIVLSNPVTDGFFALMIATQEAIQRWGASNPLVPLVGIAAGLIYGIIPYLGAIMLFLRKKSDLFVSKRELRPRLFVFGLISYLVGIVLFWRLGLMWLASFSFVMLLGAIIYFLITCRWKISIHVSGLVVPLTILSIWNSFYVVLGLLLVPALMWARVRLGTHTWPQVIVSAVVSLIVTYSGAFLFIPMYEKFALDFLQISCTSSA